jgi:hypothetical protein
MICFHFQTASSKAETVMDRPPALPAAGIVATAPGNASIFGCLTRRARAAMKIKAFNGAKDFFTLLLRVDKRTKRRELQTKQAASRE